MTFDQRGVTIFLNKTICIYKLFYYSNLNINTQLLLWTEMTSSPIQYFLSWNRWDPHQWYTIMNRTEKNRKIMRTQKKMHIREETAPRHIILECLPYFLPFPIVFFENCIFISFRIKFKIGTISDVILINSRKSH